jgi:hypothetical protein
MLSLNMDLKLLKLHQLYNKCHPQGTKYRVKDDLEYPFYIQKCTCGAWFYVSDVGSPIPQRLFGTCAAQAIAQYPHLYPLLKEYYYIYNIMEIEYLPGRFESMTPWPEIHHNACTYMRQKRRRIPSYWVPGPTNT